MATFMQGLVVYFGYSTHPAGDPTPWTSMPSHLETQMCTGYEWKIKQPTRVRLVRRLPTTQPRCSCLGPSGLLVQLLPPPASPPWCSPALWKEAHSSMQPLPFLPRPQQRLACDHRRPVEAIPQGLTCFLSTCQSESLQDLPGFSRINHLL